MNNVIGIGEYFVSNKEGDVITTYALASCVAVTLYCPVKKASGMIHIALPEPAQDNINVKRLGYYATTGLPSLFETMKNAFGCKKNELAIQLYGGANSIRSDDVFRIGQKNIEAIKSILVSYGLGYNLKEVGGYVSRTIEMEVSTGCIKTDTQAIQI